MPSLLITTDIQKVPHTPILRGAGPSSPPVSPREATQPHGRVPWQSPVTEPRDAVPRLALSRCPAPAPIRTSGALVCTGRGRARTGTVFLRTPPDCAGTGTDRGRTAALLRRPQRDPGRTGTGLGRTGAELSCTDSKPICTGPELVRTGADPVRTRIGSVRTGMGWVRMASEERGARAVRGGSQFNSVIASRYFPWLYVLRRWMISSCARSRASGLAVMPVMCPLHAGMV